jgi:FkbM family methyltransferase
MDYLKHIFIRTPLQKPLEKLRFQLNFQQRIKHPELREIYLENSRIESALERTLNQHSNCIDIGCHIGSTLNTILDFAPNGNHIAVEAIPYKADWLKTKFPEVDIKHLALSDTTGEVTFYINNRKSGFSSIYPNPSEKVQDLKAITVKCDTLDNLLAPDYQLDFIKIDVEGAELAVLRGAQNTLSHYKPTVLFECVRGSLLKFGNSPEDMFDFLTKKHQYAVFLLKDFLNDDLPLNFEQFDNALNYPFQAFNFIATCSKK